MNLKKWNSLRAVPDREIKGAEETVAWIAHHLGVDGATVKKALLADKPNNSFTVCPDELFDDVFKEIKPAYDHEARMRVLTRIFVAAAVGTPLLAAFVTKAASVAVFEAAAAWTYVAGVPLVIAGVALAEWMQSKFDRDDQPRTEAIAALKVKITEAAAAFDQKHGTGEFAIEAESETKTRFVPDVSERTTDRIIRKTVNFAFQRKIEPDGLNL